MSLTRRSAALGPLEPLRRPGVSGCRLDAVLPGRCADSEDPSRGAGRRRPLWQRHVASHGAETLLPTPAVRPVAAGKDRCGGGAGVSELPIFAVPVPPPKLRGNVAPRHRTLPSSASVPLPPKLIGGAARPARVHDRLLGGHAEGGSARVGLVEAVHDWQLGFPSPRQQPTVRWSALKTLYTELVDASNGTCLENLARTIARAHELEATTWPELKVAEGRRQALACIRDELQEVAQSPDIDEIARTLEAASALGVTPCSWMHAKPWQERQAAEMRLMSLRALRQELVAATRGAAMERLAFALKKATEQGVSSWTEAAEARARLSTLHFIHDRLRDAAAGISPSALDAMIKQAETVEVSDDCELPLGPMMMIARRRLDGLRSSAMPSSLANWLREMELGELGRKAMLDAQFFQDAALHQQRHWRGVHDAILALSPLPPPSPLMNSVAADEAAIAASRSTMAGSPSEAESETRSTREAFLSRLYHEAKAVLGVHPRASTVEDADVRPLSGSDGSNSAATLSVSQSSCASHEIERLLNRIQADFEGGSLSSSRSGSAAISLQYSDAQSSDLDEVSSLFSRLLPHFDMGSYKSGCSENAAETPREETVSQNAPPSLTAAIAEDMFVGAPSSIDAASSVDFSFEMASAAVRGELTSRAPRVISPVVPWSMELNAVPEPQRPSMEAISERAVLDEVARATAAETAGLIEFVSALQGREGAESTLLASQRASVTAAVCGTLVTGLGRVEDPTALSATEVTHSAAGGGHVAFAPTAPPSAMHASGGTWTSIDLSSLRGPYGGGSSLHNDGGYAAAGGALAHAVVRDASSAALGRSFRRSIWSADTATATPRGIRGFGPSIVARSGAIETVSEAGPSSAYHGLPRRLAVAVVRETVWLALSEATHSSETNTLAADVAAAAAAAAEAAVARSIDGTVAAAMMTYFVNRQSETAARDSDAATGTGWQVAVEILQSALRSVIEPPITPAPNGAVRTLAASPVSMPVVRATAPTTLPALPSAVSPAAPSPSLMSTFTSFGGLLVARDVIAEATEGQVVAAMEDVGGGCAADMADSGVAERQSDRVVLTPSSAVGNQEFVDLPGRVVQEVANFVLADSVFADSPSGPESLEDGRTHFNIAVGDAVAPSRVSLVESMGHA